MVNPEGAPSLGLRPDPPDYSALLQQSTSDSFWNPECCNDRQVDFLVEYFCLALACVVLWRSKLLLPWKCFATFLHELGHACMVWLFCGKVTGIEVHSDQGGLTHFEGVAGRSQLRSIKLREMFCKRYAQFWILPAGYLGSAIWAAAIVIMSGGDICAVVIAFILSFFLLIALFFSFFGEKEKFGWALPFTCIFNLAIFLGLGIWCLADTYVLRYRILEAWLIFIGVLNSIFASWDIIEDTVARTVERSDAYRFADMLKCCPARCVGAVWFLLSLCSLAAAFYFGLLMRKGDDADEPKYWNTVIYVFSGSVVAFAIGWRILCDHCCNSEKKKSKKK